MQSQRKQQPTPEGALELEEQGSPVLSWTKSAGPLCPLVGQSLDAGSPRTRRWDFGQNSFSQLSQSLTDS